MIFIYDYCVAFIVFKPTHASTRSRLTPDDREAAREAAALKRVISDHIVMCLSCCVQINLAIQSAYLSTTQPAGALPWCWVGVSEESELLTNRLAGCRLSQIEAKA